MKSLLLVRHAKSSWDDSSLQDIDRPLNQRGKKDAPFMGGVLRKNHSINPDRILSSPAVRALTTAKIISGELKFPAKKIEVIKKLYSASIADLLQVVNSLGEDHSTIMLFGHNPELTVFSNFLSGKFIDNIPTCGIVKLDFSNEWKEIKENSGRIDFFIYPKAFST